MESPSHGSVLGQHLILTYFNGLNCAVTLSKIHHFADDRNMFSNSLKDAQKCQYNLRHMSSGSVVQV